MRGLCSYKIWNRSEAYPEQLSPFSHCDHLQLCLIYTQHPTQLPFHQEISTTRPTLEVSDVHSFLKNYLQLLAHQTTYCTLTEAKRNFAKYFDFSIEKKINNTHQRSWNTFETIIEDASDTFRKTGAPAKIKRSSKSLCGTNTSHSFSYSKGSYVHVK